MVITDKGKIKIFLNWLRSNFANNVLIKDNPLKSYIKALSKAQRSEVMRLRITREIGE